MTRAATLLAASLLAGAAGPTSSFSTATPWPDFRPPPRPAPVPVGPPGYAAAPTPNSDASAPQSRASGDTSVSPGLFSRRNQYRGEGISPDSSAQIEQDRRAKPGAGINLRVPLQ